MTTAELLATLSPDDQAWISQMERHATALKIAIDSNRKIISAARLAAMRTVDAAVRAARYEIEPRPTREEEDF